MMGGSGAHEYMAPCAAGENEVALRRGLRRQRRGRLGRAAARRAAAGARRAARGADARADHGRRGLGGARRARRGGAQGDAGRGRGPRPRHGPGPRRPPPQRDQARATQLGADLRPGDARRRSRREIGPAGFIGPVGAKVPVLKDAAIQGEGFFGGANRPDHHLIGVSPGRDFEFEEVDVRSVEAGRHGARRRRDRDRARRSRSATSSSSAPATRSRSAPPTSTSPARSARS